MIRYIQLQHTDTSIIENNGGLYLNVEHISAVRFDRKTNTCRILMSCGVEYTVLQTTSEVLDMLRESEEE